VLGVVGVVVLAALVWFVKKNERRLLEDAQREMGSGDRQPVRSEA